jgi:5-methylcytosine-specific restriction endonuclease McrA
METIKHKRGAVNSNGLVFWAYGNSYPNNEYWVTPEKFNDLYKKRQDTTKKNYDENKEKRSLQRKERRKNNREEYLLVAKAGRERNKEKIKEYFRNYYKNHKDRVALANKKWREKNWARMSGLLAKYRTKKVAQTPDLSSESKMIIAIFFEQAQRLSKTIGIPFEVDHIIPISLGGFHSPSNLQVIPRSLNRKKHNKKIFVWSEKNS